MATLTICMACSRPITDDEVNDYGRRCATCARRDYERLQVLREFRAKTEFEALFGARRTVH